MIEHDTAIFFYGLFMDEKLLARKGIRVRNSVVGHVDGYRLRIGDRATLVPEPGGRAHGIIMTIESRAVDALYSDQSVSDYVAEKVSVTIPGEGSIQARCYNLPAKQLRGANPAYAETLLQLAATLGFPDDYLDTIRLEGQRT